MQNKLHNRTGFILITSMICDFYMRFCINSKKKIFIITGETGFYNPP